MVSRHTSIQQGWDLRCPVLYLTHWEAAPGKCHCLAMRAKQQVGCIELSILYIIGCVLHHVINLHALWCYGKSATYILGIYSRILSKILKRLDLVRFILKRWAEKLVKIEVREIILYGQLNINYGKRVENDPLKMEFWFLDKAYCSVNLFWKLWNIVCV